MVDTATNVETRRDDTRQLNWATSRIGRIAHPRAPEFLPRRVNTERAAIRDLLAQLTEMRLTLPREARRRHLRFEVQAS
jgi:hypothetical protein